MKHHYEVKNNIIINYNYDCHDGNDRCSNNNRGNGDKEYKDLMLLIAVISVLATVGTLVVNFMSLMVALIAL